MGYYLAKGKVEKASEVAEKLNDPQVFDKLHYMVKEGGHKFKRINCGYFQEHKEFKRNY